MRLRLRDHHRGDTIVEVLIAIVVVSMVLVAAYVMTTRNINAMQDTQEHSESLQLAQAQLEFLHNYSSPSSWANGNCFMPDGSVTSTHCNVNGDGCPLGTTGCPPAGTVPQFNVSISKNASNTFKVAITWAGLENATHSNNVTLYYQP